MNFSQCLGHNLVPSEFPAAGAEIKKIRPLHKLLSTSDRGLFIGIQAIDAAGKMGWSTMG